MLKNLLVKLGILRRSGLAFASGPVSVSLKARVASPSTVVSPMTGMRSAFIELVVGERRVVQSADDGQREIEEFERLGSMIVGGSLLLESEDGLIEVPTEGVRFAFPGVANLSVTNVDRPLPKELQHVMNRILKGTACYREHTLSEGDPVTLTGMVGPKVARKGGASAEDAAWIARPDLGPVTVRDDSLSSL